MMKYFNLQLKRAVRFFPFVLTVTLVLFLGVAVILSSFLQSSADDEKNSRFKIALTGDTDNEYMQWGLAAMQSLDETKFSIDLFFTDTEKAEKMLKKGVISAYVVIPEDFISNALRGKIEPLSYVTTSGGTGLVTMFKNEVTHLVTDLLIYSEKGVYGIEDALDTNGHEDVSGDYMDDLNLDYLNLILHRGDILDITELGVSNGLSTAEYYVCSITVLLLLLIGIPYAAVYIKKDHSLGRLLISRGQGNFSQLLGEYSAHFISLWLLAAIIFVLCGSFLGAMPLPEDTEFITAPAFFALIYKIIPVILMISAFNLMIFELSGNIVSGILMHFFSVLCLCYASGCFFPVYTLPKVLQKLSVFLPTGLAREYLEGCITGEDYFAELLGLVAFAAAFFGAALFARHLKTVRKNQG